MPRVLVIGNPSLHHVAEALFTSEGYEVSLVATPDEGRRTAETLPPDVVVMNTGLEGAARMEAMAKLLIAAPEARILDLTEPSEPKSPFADDLINKPVDAAELLMKVKGLLENAPTVTEVHDAGSSGLAS